MRSLILSFFCLLLVPFTRLLAEEAATQSFIVLGWMEEALVVDDEFIVRAKLDTGADTSSLHAENLEINKQNNGEWVKFDVTNSKGKEVTFKRKVRRYADIKRKNGKSQSRPVVKIGICVGNVFEVVEFTLVDRSNFSTIALIGRNFLSGKIFVDSSTSYTTEPECSSNK